MNWIMIVSCIVFFILGIVFYMSNPNNYASTFLGKIWELICCFFVSLFFSIIFGAIFGGFINFIGRMTLETENKIHKSYELVALDTNEDINGSYSNFFFVGSGYIGEDIYYHFYYKTSNGIKYDKIRAENCYIVEMDDTPSYKVHGEYYKDTSSVFYDKDLIRETKKVLYIPKGTIKSNYKVN